MEDLKRIQLGPDLLDRWTQSAEAIVEEGHALRIGLNDVRSDSTRQMLRRAAEAARETAKQLNNDEAKAAIDIATELEAAAENGPEAN